MASGTDLGVLSSQAREILPGKVADNGYQVQRSDGYGDLFVRQFNPVRAAQEGSYFVMQNATAGTGIAQTANTTQDTTKPFIALFMNTAGGKSFYLDYLMMKPTAVSSGQTTQNIDVLACSGNAYSSAGTDYSSKATGIATAGYRASNMGVVGSSALSVARVGVPVTALTGTDNRQLAHFVPRTSVIPVAGDMYFMYFGRAEGQQGISDIAGTTTKVISLYGPPVIMAPGTSLIIIPWAASIAGAMSWEFEMGWWER